MKTAGRRAIGILVLGMHRSGTSALARMLNLLGCALPSDLLGSNYSNPEGHWESLRAIEINDSLLAALGRRWDDIRGLPPDWLQRPDTELARLQIRAFIDLEFSSQKLWVLKEPRLCRLAPLWLQVLEQAGIDARIVIPVRHPAEVAYSLARRDGTAAGRSHLMWLQHLVEAEAASRGAPRVLTHFDELLTDWRRQAKRIGSELRLVWPNKPTRAVSPIDEFLKPELRHADAASAEDAAASVPLPAPVARLYQSLLADHDPWQAIARLAAELEEAWSLYAPGIGDLALRAERTEQRAVTINTLLSSGLAGPERWRENAERIAQLGEQSRGILGKLEAAAPLLHELLRQIEEQRREVGPALDSHTQQFIQWGLETRQLLERLDPKEVTRKVERLEQIPALVQDLSQQIEAQRREVGPALDQHFAQLIQWGLETRQLLERLDPKEVIQKVERLEQIPALVQGLSQQIEAQHREVGPALDRQLQQVVELRSETQLLLERLVHELVRQIEAQLGEKQLQATLSERDRVIVELTQAVTERDARIVELEQVVASHTTRIAQQGREASEREAEAARLRQIVADGTSHIAHLDHLIAERDRLIAGQARRISSLERTVADFRATLGQLLSSHSWRLTQPLRAVTSLMFRRSGSTEERVHFDPVWYLTEYPDVAASGIDPYDHYVSSGKREGRYPAPPAGSSELHEARLDFDPVWYLSEYPDVAASGMDPYQHYISKGKKEERQPLPVPFMQRQIKRLQHAKATLPSTMVRVGRLAADKAVIVAERMSGAVEFDSRFYLERYPDVAGSGIDPYQHYLDFY